MAPHEPRAASLPAKQGRGWAKAEPTGFSLAEREKIKKTLESLINFQKKLGSRAY
jgi:hypothetical protein